MLRQNQHRILKISLKLGYLCTSKFLCPVSFLAFTVFSVSEVGILPQRCLTDSKPVTNAVLLNMALQPYVGNKGDNNTLKISKNGISKLRRYVVTALIRGYCWFYCSFSQMFLK